MIAVRLIISIIINNMDNSITIGNHSRMRMLNKSIRTVQVFYLLIFII